MTRGNNKSPIRGHEAITEFLKAAIRPFEDALLEKGILAQQLAEDAWRSRIRTADRARTKYGIDNLTPDGRDKFNQSKNLCSHDHITPLRCRNIAKLAQCIS